MMMINIFNMQKQLCQITKKLNRIQKEFQVLKPFINNYIWKRINYLSKIEDWERIALNLINVP